MSYCVLADVQSEFKDITFTSTTFVKDSDVNAFIAEADQLINSIIGKRYETPVVGVEALVLLRMYSRLLVAERVRKILEVKQTTNAQTNSQVRGMLTSKDILEALYKIQKGDADLPGVDPISSEQGFTSEITSLSPDRKFHKDAVEW